MKHIKKILIAALVVAVLGSVSMIAVRAQEIEVYYDGEKMEFDTKIYIENDRVMVPMRSLFERAGMRVEWKEATGAIVATRENKKISMQVGNYDITNDGVVTTYDAAAKINDDGKTMIPLRAVGESLGMNVEWNAIRRHVYITEEKEEETEDESWKDNTGEIDLDNMSVSGEGVAVDGNVIKITAGGDFKVFGTLSDGYIHVNTEQRVKLRLSGASITNPAGSAIYFENADKCFITISKDTENVLTDGASYTDTELKGAVYAKDDLEIKGEGTLTINANYKHGIAGNDEIKIEEGNIIINCAVGDGIRVNDGIEMTGGSLDITAFSDAVQSEGYVTLTGGSIKAKTVGKVVEDEIAEVVDGVALATTSAKGIKAETVITIDGAVIDLDTTDNSIDSADIIIIDSGDINIISGDKAISGEGDVTINDGTIKIDCATEGIESKNILTVNGGDIDIKSLDDGLNTGGGTTMNFGGMGGGRRPNGNMGGERIPAGQNTNGQVPEMPKDGTIPGGEQNAARPGRPMGGNMTPPEMNGEMTPPQIPEGSAPFEETQNGVRPQRPDGENMTPPEWAQNGQMPENMAPPELTESENTEVNPYECHDLYINGGNVKIDAACDGIDSNGKIFVTGGSVIIDGPVNNGNGAIDTDSQFVVTGGEIIAVGSSGMAVAPNSNESTQCSINVNFNADLAAETLIIVKDESGNTVMEFTNAKQCRNLIYSSDKLEEGKTYTISAGEQSITTTAMISYGRGGFGGMGGGRGGRW